MTTDNCSSCSQPATRLFQIEKTKDALFCSLCLHQLGVEALEELNKTTKKIGVTMAEVAKSLEHLSEVVGRETEK